MKFIAKFTISIKELFTFVKDIQKMRIYEEGFYFENDSSNNCRYERLQKKENVVQAGKRREDCSVYSKRLLAMDLALFCCSCFCALICSAILSAGPHHSILRFITRMISSYTCTELQALRKREGGGGEQWRRKRSIAASFS